MTRLSSKLSPQAKRLVLRKEPTAVRVLLKLRPSASRSDFERHAAEEALAVEILSWSSETGLASVETRTDELGRIADLDEVMTIERSAYRA